MRRFAILLAISSTSAMSLAAQQHATSTTPVRECGACVASLAPADASEAWRGCLETIEGLPAPARLSAYLLFRQAAAELASGRLEAARSAAEAARTEVTRLGYRSLGTKLDHVTSMLDAAALRGHHPEQGPLGSLTARERQVLELVAEGLNNREIARRLYISHKTVSVHVSSILAKLHKTGRTEIAVLASRQEQASGPEHDVG